MRGVQLLCDMVGICSVDASSGCPVVAEVSF